MGVPKERPLEKTYWVLVELNGQSIPQIDSRKIFIQLNPDTKKVTGHGGCNRLFGEYFLDGRKIIFKEIGSTKMFCEDSMKTENDFLQAVNKINEFRITEHELLLIDGKNVLLKFQSEEQSKN